MTRKVRIDFEKLMIRESEKKADKEIKHLQTLKKKLNVFTAWKGGRKPLWLYEIYEMKRFLNSKDDNLKRLDAERIKKP